MKETVTVKDIARTTGKSVQSVLHAKDSIEIHGRYEFQKTGRAYEFNPHEQKMILDVLKNGIAAAKQTRYFHGEPKKEVYL